MCTAATYYAKDHYFGRNLDLEFSYHEEITIVPRNYPFIFRKCEGINHHYAMIGTAFVVEGYPLFYDAVNEKGLGIAGLNFPGNAAYKAEVPDADNVAPFEFIPWILSRCADVDEAKTLISRMNPVNISFSPELPLTPLHWMIADKKNTIVVEAVEEGVKVYENPVHVLTNNPPFPYHMMNLNILRNRFLDY